MASYTKPTGADESRRGITRRTTGGRENVPPPTTGGGGAAEATKGESPSGSNAIPTCGGAAAMTAEAAAAPKKGGEGGASFAGGSPRMRRPLRSSMVPKNHRRVSSRAGTSSRAGRSSTKWKRASWSPLQKRSWRPRQSARDATTRTSGRRERENSMRCKGPKTTINRAMCWRWSSRRCRNWPSVKRGGR